MITYEPNHEFNQGGDQYQACKTLVNGKLLENVLYYTFIPYNFTKQIKSWYEVFAFDCLDPKYEEKLNKLKEFVKDLDTEIIEDEAIFFGLSEDESGERLKSISEKLEKLMK